MAAEGPQMTSRRLLVDKERLSKAVKLVDNERFINFACAQQLLLNEFPLNAVRVENLGVVKLPVSLQDVGKLKQISREAPYGKGKNVYFDPSIIKALQIDSFQILEPSGLDLSPLIIRKLGLETQSVNIQAKLERLVLYEVDGHYKRDVNSENDFVKFGTAIIQLPVEGRHEGGRFNIEYKGRKKTFESHQDSDKQIYLSAFYGDCNHFMEHVTRGWKMVLVFSLIWTNAKVPVAPQDFIVFQTALKEIEVALKPWIPPRSAEPEQEANGMEVEESIASENRGMPLRVPVQEIVPDVASDILSTVSTDSDREDEYTDYDEISGSNSASKEDVLYFVLQEKYDPNTFKFDLLRGKDRNLALLLQSCPFLEVQLALVTLTGKNIESFCRGGFWGISHPRSESLSTEISRLMDSNDVSRNLTLGIDWYEQRVGPIRKLLSTDGVPDRMDRERRGEEENDEDEEDDSEEDEDDDEISVNRTQHFHNYILVIWPKHQTFQMYCRYGIHSLLDRMERKLGSASSSQAGNVRQEIVRELQKIISFCCTEPRKAWSEEWEEWDEDDDKKKGKLTLRLLRLCTALRAREEGLALLKILGSDIDSNDHYNQICFEGVQNECVAQAIVEFECKITGWADCADLIKRLISPHRLLEQFVPILKLAQYFLDAECIEGAKMAGDYIASSSAEIDASKLKRWKFKSVLAYVDLIVSLEETPQTSNRERLTSFVDFFSKLQPLLQCRLIVHLDAQNNSRFKGIDSCQVLFPDLCKALLDSDLHVEEFSYSVKKPTIKDLVVDLLKCYVRLGNGEWLKSLMSNICCVPQPSRRRKAPKNELLENLVSSPVAWELVAVSEQGQSSAFLEWRRDTCRLFVGQKFVPFVTEDMALNIILCLSRANNEVSWQSFAEKICQAFPSVKSNIFVEIFLKNVDIQQAIVNSSSAFAAVIRIVNHWIERSENLVLPTFSWCQPEATLPEHGEVQLFLRSPKESMTYSAFGSISHAREFAEELENKASTNGFSVHVTPKGRKCNVRCKIVKNRSFQEEAVRAIVTRKSQVPQLVQLRERLTREREVLVA